VRRQGNLPLQLTSFIGREQLLAEVTRRLSQSSPACRLLTLTGAGGTGKTRLALEAAEALRDRFDGVYFVPLAPISDTGLIATAIAQAVGVGDAMGHPSVTTLSDYIRDQHVLLVLDNFEQLLSGASQTTDLLAASPRLSLLVTSRAPLRVSGERELAVPPLALPQQPAHDELAAQRLEALSKSESVSLFVDRAQAVKADFSLTSENTPAVVEICRSVDGLPLAIELATARMRFLDPWTVLERLEHRLQFLTGGARDLPTRQHTLRNTIAWSYDLLEPSEQVLFRRLSVFVGGCDLEAAQAVCADDDDVLDGIDSLVAKSLLQSVAVAQGDVRISMLETIREFGVEQLAFAGELETLRWRHAEYFLQLAERAEPELWTSAASRWLHRLDLDHDNFRAALEWCLGASSQTHPEIALRMAGALCQFWWTRSYFDEGRRWLARALAGTTGRSARRMKALHGAGWLAHFQRDSTSARALLSESLAIAQQANDRWAVAWVFHALGRVAYFENDPATARTLGQESLEIAEGIGDRWLIAWAHHLLGLAAHITADYPAAQAEYERSLAIRREVGHQMGTGILIQLLGMLAHRQRDFASAQAQYLDSLETFRDISSHWQMSQMLALFASLAAMQHQPERAARLVGATETATKWSRTQPIPLTEELFREGCDLAREALGEAGFATAVAEGRALSLDEAIAEARSVDVPSSAHARAPERTRCPADLTPTEVKVLQLLTAGQSTKQIAEELAVAVSTVERHITHIYDKTGTRGRAAAATFALRHGLA
jgi:non-specific serine/threonine protein kinase